MSGVILKVWGAVLMMLIASSIPQTSRAQSLEFGRDNLVRSCSASSNGCQQAVERALRQIRAAGLDGGRFNSQLGALAAAVVEAAQKSNHSNQSGLGQAMGSVADASSNASQKSAIRRGAQALTRANWRRGWGRGRWHGPIFGSSPG